MNMRKEKGIIEVELKSKKDKVRCPICNSFTSSIHSKLKPIKSKYLDSCGEKVNLIINKRRFHCYKCKKIFTEELGLNTKNGNISNKVKIQIRKDKSNLRKINKIIKKYIDFESEMIDSDSLSILQLISKIDEDLTDIIYEIKDIKNS